MRMRRIFLSIVAMLFCVLIPTLMSATVCYGEEDQVIWFDKVEEYLDIKEFKVFQSIHIDSSLAYEQKPLYSGSDTMTPGLLVLLLGEEERPFYDGQIVKVPDGKRAWHVGIFRYESKGAGYKTVPIVRIY